MNNELIIEIEQSMLGCCFRNNDALVKIMETGFSSNDFLISEHAALFDRMRELYQSRNSFCVADMTSVIGAFPDDMDASLYARNCADFVVPASQAPTYAENLKEQSKKRTISAALKEAEAILPSKDSSEVLALISAMIAENTTSQNLKTGKEVFTDIMKEMQLPPQKWSTGISLLDRAMGGGLYEGFVYGFAGKEKSGKTTLAGTISFNLDQSNCKHIYVALEMGSREIEKRNIARRIGENSMKFRNHGKSFSEKVSAANKSKNLIYLDAPGATLEEILFQIGIAKMRYGVTGVIVDYWQLVTGRERVETEEQHIRRVAQGFANYAKKQNLWCIILAQQNKDGELFGGGGLKKACEQLYFLETPSRLGAENLRWLKMAASRYTPLVDVGSEQNPSIYLNQKSGPYFDECEDCSLRSSYDE